MPSASLRIAVTGASGYIGGALIKRLERDPNVELTLATDIRPPRREFGERVEFVRQDISQPFPRLFDRYGIDSVAHLAFAMKPGRDADSARRVNIIGMDNTLAACANAGVRRILYLSSASVYGAHPDNPEYLTENDPIRPNAGFQYSEDKAAAEARLIEYARKRPSANVAILRACPALGPTADNFIARAFRKPILPALGYADPHMQFAHEDDIARGMARCLRMRASGVYNIAGYGTIRWSEMAAIANARLARLPPAAWRALVALGWRLGLQTDAPACGLDFIRYRWTVSAEKIRRELGIVMRYSSRQAWQSFAFARETKGRA